jgi:hypothetical protein
LVVGVPLVIHSAGLDGGKVGEIEGIGFEALGGVVDCKVIFGEGCMMMECVAVSGQLLEVVAMRVSSDVPG